MSLSEKIQAIEDEMKRTQVNKRTEHHLGLLKAKLARLKAEQEISKRSRQSGAGFELKKEGDCTVVLVGPPSVGKSLILNRLTNAKSKVSSYAFTTTTVVPGLFEHKGARIQVLDLPSVMLGAASETGRGRKVLSVARNADLIMLVIDVFQLDQVDFLRRELHEVGIRVNARPPNVTIEKAGQGGLSISTTCTLTKLSASTARAVLNAYGIHHGKVVIKEDMGDDELIDAVAGNRHYVPAITVLNKVDLVGDEYLAEAGKKLREGFLPISADRNTNLDELKEVIYNRLNFIRVYLKPRDGEPDFDAPLIVTAGSTVFNVCVKIHRSFAEEAKYALVSGTSVRFNNQRVGMAHAVHDGDILTIIR